MSCVQEADVKSQYSEMENAGQSSTSEDDYGLQVTAHNSDDDEVPQLLQVSELTLEDEDRDTAQTIELARLVRTAEGAQLFVDNVKSSHLLSNYHWGDILSSAPRALASLGQCFVVASSPLAASIKLLKSDELKYDSVRANLVHCSDLGRAAFREAETKMDVISSKTQYICSRRGTIDRILDCTEDEEVMEDDLDDQLDKLRKFSDMCVQDTAAVRDKFQTWLNQAEALNAACHEAQSKAVRDERETDNKSRTAENMLLRANKRVADTEKRAQGYQANLNLAQKEFVHTKEQLSQKSVSEYLEDATSLLKSAAWFLPDTGKSLFDSAKKALTRKDFSSITGSESEGSIDRAQRYAADANIAINGFQNSLSYDLGEKNWDVLSGLSKLPLPSVLTVMHILENLSKQYPPVSHLMLLVSEILGLVSIVAFKIQQEIDSQHQFSRSRAEELARDLKGAATRNDELIAKFASMAQEAALKKKQENDEYNRGSSKRARKYAKYQRALEAFDKSEQRLWEMQKEQQQQNDEFDALQAELEGLATGKITMGEVKRVLSNSIDNLSRFKTNIDGLLAFFVKINESINIINNTYVGNVSDDAKNVKKNFREGQSLRSKQRRIENLRFSALQLRGQYAVAGEIAETYVDVSQRYIIPGVNQMDRLSIMAAGEGSEDDRLEIARKSREVNEYSEKAQKCVTALADKRRANLENALLIRRGEVQELLEEVPKD